MANINAKRDDNWQPVIQGETNDANRETRSVLVDPVTGRVLTNTSVSGDIEIAPLSTVYHGTKTCPTLAAEAIASSQAIHSVTVKALSTNTVAVYVGASGVTTANGFELLAGESVTVDIDNLASVYVISGSASQVVRYIAV
jgi:hypothetical protein